MIWEISLGSVVMLVTLVIGGASAWVTERLLTDAHGWLLRAPHRPKLFVVVMTTTLGGLAVITSAVWIWAALYRLLGVFDAWEPAVYFSLVTLTTLGYGDTLLPPGWRVLGAMEAANGLILFGLITALMVDTLRQLHRMQRRAGRR